MSQSKSALLALMMLLLLMSGFTVNAEPEQLKNSLPENPW